MTETPDPTSATPATEPAVTSDPTGTAAGADFSADAAGRELEELKDRHARLAAEFDNYRKRVLKERSELEDRAQAKLLSRLLDALDDLDRVAASDAATTPLEAVRGAVDSVHRKLWKELAAGGVEKLDPAGQPFDPALHEGVSIIAPPTPEQERIVAATFQAGYVMKGQLVRPARVQVYAAEGLL